MGYFGLLLIPTSFARENPRRWRQRTSAGAGPDHDDDEGAVACDELADAGRCEAAVGAAKGVGAVPAAGAD